MRLAFLFLILSVQVLADFPMTVGVKWSASLNSNIVASYQVYWGTNSHAYQNCTNVKKALQWVMPQFPTNFYYFAATCLDSNGLESDFSNEVGAVLPYYPPVGCTFEKATSPFGPWTVITQFMFRVEMQPTNVFYRSVIHFNFGK